MRFESFTNVTVRSPTLYLTSTPSLYIESSPRYSLTDALSDAICLLVMVNFTDCTFANTFPFLRNSSDAGCFVSDVINFEPFIIKLPE